MPNLISSLKRLNNNEDKCYFQNINVEGKPVEADLLGKNISSTRCRYDKIEISEHIADVESSEALPQDSPNWKLATIICGDYPNASPLR